MFVWFRLAYLGLGAKGFQGYLAHKKTAAPLGPYSRTMPRVLRGSWRGGCSLMGEVPLYLPCGMGVGWFRGSGCRVSGLKVQGAGVKLAGSGFRSAVFDWFRLAYLGAG